MSQEPLPCPFCGSAAELETPDCGTPNHFAVRCPDCDLSLMTGYEGIGWHSTEDEAVESWNRRNNQNHESEPTALEQVNEDLLKLFKSAMNYGLIYGSRLEESGQWGKMRDVRAAEFVQRAHEITTKPSSG